MSFLQKHETTLFGDEVVWNLNISKFKKFAIWSCSWKRSHRCSFKACQFCHFMDEVTWL